MGRNPRSKLTGLLRCLIAGLLAGLLGCAAGPDDGASRVQAGESGEVTSARRVGAAAGPGPVASRQGEPEAPAGPIRLRIPPPRGYEKIPAAAGSFGAWLRELPLRPGRSVVRLHDGSEKRDQSVHHAVLDVDVGPEDLQQCADAVIRLRAEFLFSTACRDEIRFDFTSGDTARWADWRRGLRPAVSGDRVSWHETAPPDDSRASFRRYLDVVFMYAGSASLSRELLPVGEAAKPAIGDVFIQGGYPGHAVLVVDVAVNESGERVFLLAQSYMPAQDIHILRSFDDDISPWYRARSTGLLRTPEWGFRYGDLKRFRYTRCDTAAGETPG